MHPASSLILFTTLAGAGYGLLAVLGVALAAGMVAPAPRAGLLGQGLGLAMVTAGLLASTRHLGRPDRAWLAFSQWRSSWLSREAVAAALTFPPALLTLWGWAGRGEAWPLAALLTASGAVVTVLCTGQIYATLKPIARWRDPLTTPCYLALAAATGAVAAAAALRLAAAPSLAVETAALLLLALAWPMKALWWRRTDRAEAPATPETATGLFRFRDVRLTEPPHTAANYLQQEMGFRLARKHSRKLRRVALVAGALVPAAVLLTGLAVRPPAAAMTVLSCLGLAAALLGTGVERWLFFAEARHTVTLYYGASRA